MAKWSEIVFTQWAQDPANAELDNMDTDFENYKNFPKQLYNILQSRGRDLAGSVAYWYAIKFLGFDPSDEGTGHPQEPDAGVRDTSNPA